MRRRKENERGERRKRKGEKQKRKRGGKGEVEKRKCEGERNIYNKSITRNNFLKGRSEER